MDFAITPEGDLVFEKAKEPSRFKLDFRLVRNNGLQVKFHAKNQPTIKPQAQFKLNFLYKRDSTTYYKTSVVEGIEEKLQQIRVALTTERGELSKREKIGSRLSTVRHQNIHNNENLRLAEEYTREALADILPDAEIIVKPELGEGNFYCQNISIYIYEKGVLIFKFHI